ncbi:hypothetical protein A2U01_0085789, partial [Trifolium medium]|nr:hypothetical protein [Trifolium medium]
MSSGDVLARSIASCLQLSPSTRKLSDVLSPPVTRRGWATGA